MAEGAGGRGPSVDWTALIDCVTSPACMVTQTTAGLISGAVLFLVAAGLTLIFGVLKVTNFAHGVFYMLGAYVAYTIIQLGGGYALAVLGAAVAMGAFGLLFQQALIRPVMGGNVLTQLLVCYAVVLICDDLVRMIWGPEFLSVGMPEMFQVPPVFLAGGAVPPFYIFLVGIALLIALALGFALAGTRLGKTVRAVAHNPDMVEALGINTAFIFAAVFALGGALAGLAGALAAPVRSLTPGMGFSILIESFIVTVVGGMGSILGALTGAVLLGLVHSFGSIVFPLFADGLVYLCMIAVLLIRPAGLFGREIA
jgi:branched-chain amino acid transport system permease protein